jgi:hypothetical protein
VCCGGALRAVCLGFAVAVRLRGARVLVPAAAAAVFGARLGARAGATASAAAGSAVVRSPPGPPTAGSALSPMSSPIRECAACASAARGSVSWARSSTDSVLGGRACSKLTTPPYQATGACEPPAVRELPALGISCEEHNDPTTRSVNPCPPQMSPGILAEA